MPSAALSSSLPLSPPSTDVAGRSLAIGGYGGIYWLHEQAETRVSEKGTSLPISEGMTKAEEVDCGMDFDEGSSNACDSHSSRTRPHEIGATATITLAVSPDERWLAIGCLDRRMRIFDLKHSTGTSEDAGTVVELTRGENEEEAPRVELHSLKNQPHLNGESGRVVKWLDSGRCVVRLDDGRGPFNIAPKNLKRISTHHINKNGEDYGRGEFGHRGGLNKGSTNAVDWVGFDGPVKTILFSGTRRGGGEWLAAMGGSTLLVIPRRLRPGKAAIRCVVTCPHDAPSLRHLKRVLALLDRTAVGLGAVVHGDRQLARARVRHVPRAGGLEHLRVRRVPPPLWRRSRAWPPAPPALPAPAPMALASAARRR